VPGTYPHARYCDLAEVELARFVATVRGADPTVPVPTCGRWLLADLIQHVGHIHRWAAGMVAELSRERHSRRKADLPLPSDPARYADWLADSHHLVLPVLRGADPDARMWAWGPDKRVRFWSRRVLHETAVHHGDAVLALGRSPEIPSEIAVDGVDELLENLPSTGGGITKRMKQSPYVGGRLRFSAPDAGQDWTVTLTDAGYEWQRTPKGRAAGIAATVRGSVADLYLMLWQRYRWDDGSRFAVTGDKELVQHWYETSAR
jgi:uncharacterized protein (TIGR03083 family)